MEEILATDSDEVFFAERLGGGVCGFLETAIRSRADGCERHPVGYIEGWYVDPDARRQGVGRALVEAAESWARSKGCRQMASEAELWNAVSHQVHGRWATRRPPGSYSSRKTWPEGDGSSVPHLRAR